jgi:hypothetical protein
MLKDRRSSLVPPLWCLSVGGVLCLSAPHTVQSNASLLLAYDRLPSPYDRRYHLRSILGAGAVLCLLFFLPSPSSLVRRVCRAGTRNQKWSGSSPPKFRILVLACATHPLSSLLVVTLEIFASIPEKVQLQICVVT